MVRSSLNIQYQSTGVGSLPSLDEIDLIRNITLHYIDLHTLPHSPQHLIAKQYEYICMLVFRLLDKRFSFKNQLSIITMSILNYQIINQLSISTPSILNYLLSSTTLFVSLRASSNHFSSYNWTSAYASSFTHIVHFLLQGYFQFYQRLLHSP